MAFVHLAAGIDMEMPPGTTTALVGKSGGGKSTSSLIDEDYTPSYNNEAVLKKQ